MNVTFAAETHSTNFKASQKLLPKSNFVKVPKKKRNKQKKQVEKSGKCLCKHKRGVLKVLAEGIICVDIEPKQSVEVQHHRAWVTSRVMFQRESKQTCHEIQMVWCPCVAG